MRNCLCIFIFCSLLLGACQFSAAPVSQLKSAEALDTYCPVSVATEDSQDGNSNSINIEDLVARGLFCEFTHDLDGEVLKAAAIAFRSHVAYEVARGRTYSNSEADAVHNCGFDLDSDNEYRRELAERARRATRETSGIVLATDPGEGSETVPESVATFYVAGVATLDSNCIGAQPRLGASTGSEHYVTYYPVSVDTESTAKTEADDKVELAAKNHENNYSTQGDPTSIHNRGTMSQNALACLGGKKVYQASDDPQEMRYDTLEGYVVTAEEALRRFYSFESHQRYRDTTVDDGNFDVPQLRFARLQKDANTCEVDPNSLRANLVDIPVDSSPSGVLDTSALNASGALSFSYKGQKEIPSYDGGTVMAQTFEFLYEPPHTVGPRADCHWLSFDKSYIISECGLWQDGVLRYTIPIVEWDKPRSLTFSETKPSGDGEFGGDSFRCNLAIDSGVATSCTPI